MEAIYAIMKVWSDVNANIPLTSAEADEAVSSNTY